jgi:hypothetical protein
MGDDDNSSGIRSTDTHLDLALGAGYIRGGGGSVYLWSKDGFLAVAASPPAGFTFELHDVDKDVRVFTEVGFVHLPLPVVIFLERVPHKKLAVTSGTFHAGA